ncbi:MAG: DUF2971 domain-containing protein [Burkholderiaceae bacterium]|nr:DUF2971 domain-containing protein [Burkholderiaceae bacterium]
MNIINPPPLADSFVYHYTSSGVARDFILKNKTLRLNSFENVNDPREYKQFELTCFTPVESEIPRGQYEVVAKDIEMVLKRNVKLACFCTDRATTKEKLWSEPHTTRGWAKPNMWHHYAAGHDGVCLMFDRLKLSQSMDRHLNRNNLLHGKVIYSNQGAVPNAWVHPFSVDFTDSQQLDVIYAAQRHLSRWASRLFLEKLEDWSVENEYRWIYFDSIGGPRDVPFDDALMAIVIGENVEELTKKALLEECRRTKLEVSLLSWRNGFPMPISQW